MSSNNGSLPEGLKEMSSVAVQKQVIINEAAENAQVSVSQFLRCFNGGVMDPDMIRERAERAQDALAHLSSLLGTIAKPYLD